MSFEIVRACFESRIAAAPAHVSSLGAGSAPDIVIGLVIIPISATGVVGAHAT